MIPDSESSDTGENVESAGRLSDSEGKLPPALEARWTYWSRSIQGCDDRTMLLLRAAFESGFDAGVAYAADSRTSVAGSRDVPPIIEDVGEIS